MESKRTHGSPDFSTIRVSPAGVLAFLERGFVRNGQSLSPLSSAGGQYPAAVGCGHALAEAMFVFAFPAGRLERAFHIARVLVCNFKGVQKWLAFADFTTLSYVFSPWGDHTWLIIRPLSLATTCVNEQHPGAGPIEPPRWKTPARPICQLRHSCGRG